MQPLCVDLDDFHQTNHRLDLLHALRRANPGFRCTVFAVPGKGTDQFWSSVPRWIELAVHGWMHPDPYECAEWTEAQLDELLDRPVVRRWFAHGFKAPGWQISDACYRVLERRGWWVADQHLEDHRRPPGLRAYFYEDGGWHGHIQNVCGNGIEETWDDLLGAVTNATEFRFCSEQTR